MNVVEVVGNDVPRQLVLACGAVPRRLTGAWAGEIPAAAAALLGAVDPVAARILGEILAPGRDQPAAIVVCNDSQSHLRIFYVLRALGDDSLPPVHLLDLPRRDSAPARSFAVGQLRDLVAFCGRVTGRTPSATDLAEAARGEAVVGIAIAAVRARRREHPPRVTGGESIRAAIEASSLSSHEAAARLDAAHSEVRDDAVRVHVSGSGHPDPSVIDELEADGRIVVVSDDADTSDLAWLGVAVEGEDVFAALVEAHFARDVAAPVSLMSERAAGARARAAGARARAAVLIARDGDDGSLWDVAAIGGALAEDAIPLIPHRIRSGADPIDGIAALAQRLIEAAEASVAS